MVYSQRNEVDAWWRLRLCAYVLAPAGWRPSPGAHRTPCLCASRPSGQATGAVGRPPEACYQATGACCQATEDVARPQRPAARPEACCQDVGPVFSCENSQIRPENIDLGTNRAGKPPYQLILILQAATAFRRPLKALNRNKCNKTHCRFGPKASQKPFFAGLVCAKNTLRCGNARSAVYARLTEMNWLRWRKLLDVPSIEGDGD